MIFLDEMVQNAKSADFNELSKLSEELGYTAIQEHFAHDAGGMEVCFEAECAINALEREMIACEFTAIREAEGEGEATSGDASAESNPSLWAKIKDGVQKFFSKIKELILKVWNGIVGFVKHVIDFFTGKREEEFKKQLAEATAKATADEKARIMAALAQAEVSDISKLDKKVADCKSALMALLDEVEKFLNIQGSITDLVKKLAEQEKKIKKADEKAQKAVEKLNNAEVGKKKLRSLEEITAGLDKLNSYKGEFKEVENKASKLAKSGMLKAEKGKNSKDPKEIKAFKAQTREALKGLSKSSQFLQKFFTTVNAAKAEYRKAAAAARKAMKKNTKTIEA